MVMVTVMVPVDMEVWVTTGLQVNAVALMPQNVARMRAQTGKENLPQRFCQHSDNAIVGQKEIVLGTKLRVRVVMAMIVVTCWWC